MRSEKLRKLKRTHGSAMVEFALSLPFLLILCMGAGDLGRMFYQAVTISHAAVSGSFVGIQSNIYSGRFGEMGDAAEQDVGDVSTPENPDLTVVTDRFCDCPDNPATGPADPNAVNCATGTCPVNAYGAPRVFVRTRVGYSFRPLAKVFPAIPDAVNVNGNAYIRVQ